MIEEFDEFYTKTMADSYVQQGYLNEALEIYQQLIEQTPEDQDLHDAITAINTKLADQSDADTMDKKDLSALMNKWFDLMLAVNQLKNVNKLKLLR